MNYPKSYFLTILEVYVGVGIIAELINLPSSVVHFFALTDDFKGIYLTTLILGIILLLVSIIYTYKLIYFSNARTWTWIFFITQLILSAWYVLVLYDFSIYVFFAPLPILLALLQPVVLAILVNWRIHVLERVVLIGVVPDLTILARQRRIHLLIVFVLAAISFVFLQGGFNGVYGLAKINTFEIKQAAITNSVEKQTKNIVTSNVEVEGKIRLSDCAGAFENGDESDPKFKSEVYQKYLQDNYNGVSKITPHQLFSSCIIPGGNIILNNSIELHGSTYVTVYLDVGNGINKIYDIDGETAGMKVGIDDSSNVFILQTDFMPTFHNLKIYYVNLKTNALELVDLKQQPVTICDNKGCGDYPKN